MYEHLETAANPDNLKRVAIDPVTRVEGHGKVTLLLDENNHVKQARLHIVEFRGFERFIQGRPYWELPVLVQRLCGICPVSHHLAAAKAVDQLVGVDQLTPAAEKLRRLMHFGQTLQSHALHFFHLSTPDLLFGFEDDAAHRNVVSVLQEYPETGLKGVKLRKYGQEVIRIISGKRIHGRNDLYAIENVIEKPTPTEAEQRLHVPGLRAGYYLCFFGIHVLTPSVMELLDYELKHSTDGHLAAISSALHQLARKEKYLALEMNDYRFNVGVKYGLLNAQLALALTGNDRDEVITMLMEMLLLRERNAGERNEE